MSQCDSQLISKSKVDRPIILIHGFLGTPSDWDPFLAAWQIEAGLNASPCVTIDLLDIARRITLEGKQAIGLKELASKILADIHADERMSSGFDVIGYSMGGRIALEMAIQHGSRGSQRHEDAPTFTLLSAHPGLDDASDRNIRCASDIRLADRLATISVANEKMSDSNSPPLFLMSGMARHYFPLFECAKIS